MTTKPTTTAAYRTALVLALPLAGALLLTGCTNDDIAQSSGSSPRSSDTSAGTVAPGAGAPDAAGSATGTDNLGVVSAAAKIALDAVPSSKLLSIDHEAGGTAWEVLVATPDGKEQEIHTDAAGTKVTAGPSSDFEDPDDLAENVRFLAQAKIDFADAAKGMTDTVEGSVTELGLDDHLGKVVWEGTVVDASGTRHSIRLDSATGAVVSSDVDIDD